MVVDEAAEVVTDELMRTPTHEKSEESCPCPRVRRWTDEHAGNTHEVDNMLV